MTKQTYTQDQQVDIVSEILLTLENKNLSTKPKKMKAYEQFASSAIEAVATNCFGITNEEQIDAFFNKVQEAALIKIKDRLMEHINELPDDVRTFVQNMTESDANVQIITKKCI